MTQTETHVSQIPDGINLMHAGMIKAWVNQGIVDQGCDTMNYITPSVPGYARK